MKDGRETLLRFKPKAADQKDDEKSSEDKEQEPEETARTDITRPPKRLPVRSKAFGRRSPELREDIIARD